MLQTREIITIVVCVTNEEIPSLKALAKTLNSGIKLFKANLKVFVRKKYTNETAKEANCPIAVAQAAPRIPQCIPKINAGSNAILSKAPASIENIDQAGLPSERITAFIILDSINTGKNARIILKYSTAIPRLFSDAPNRVRTPVFKGKNTAISTKLDNRVTVIPLPTAL